MTKKKVAKKKIAIATNTTAVVKTEKNALAVTIAIAARVALVTKMMRTRKVVTAKTNTSAIANIIMTTTRKSWRRNIWTWLSVFKQILTTIARELPNSWTTSEKKAKEV